MDDEEFATELKARVHADKINIVVRHPDNTGPLILPAGSLVRKPGGIIDIHTEAADPGNPNRE